MRDGKQKLGWILALGLLASAVSILGAVPPTVPEPAPKLLLDRASALLRNPTDENTDLAKALLEQGVAAKDASCACLLAKLILEKPTSKLERAHAAEVLAMAADGGSLEAKEQLAHYLLMGSIRIDEKTDAAKAVKLASEVIQANPNSVLANRVLGEAYLFGETVEYSPSSAPTYLLVGANQGDVESMEMLGRALKQEGNWSEALTWDLKAFGAGDKMGGTMAGEMLVKGGHGLAQDAKRGYEVLKAAASAGELNASRWLAVWEFDGTIKPDNPAEIVEWAKKAGSHIDGKGFYIVAECYKAGTGVAADHEQYRAWLLKACDASNGDAAFELATLYGTGDGVEKDEKLATYYLGLAHDRGVHNELPK